MDSTHRTRRRRHLTRRPLDTLVATFSALVLLTLSGAPAPPAAAIDAAARSGDVRSEDARVPDARGSDARVPDGTRLERWELEVQVPGPGDLGARLAAPDPAESTRWTPPFGFPVDVVAAYRAPPHRYGAGHRGVDLRPPMRTGAASAAAPVDGTISFVGRVVDRPVVTIRVDDRTLVSLEPVTSELDVGARVARGQVLGALASGGHCDGACLHLGIRIDGEYTSPMPFLLDRPILLPLEE